MIVPKAAESAARHFVRLFVGKWGISSKAVRLLFSSAGRDKIALRQVLWPLCLKEDAVEPNQITCPKCHQAFALTAAIEQPIVEKLRLQFEQQGRQREAQLQSRRQELEQEAARLKTERQALEQQLQQRLEQALKQAAAEQQLKARQAVELEMRQLKDEARENQKQLEAARAERLDLLKQKRELDDARKNLEIEKAEQIEKERQAIRAEAQKAAAEAAGKQVQELRDILSAKEQLLEDMRAQESQLRKERALMEEQKKGMELEMQRRSDQIAQEVALKKEEEFHLKESQWQKKSEELTRQIEELRRKNEQGSQQTQGEALEVDLERSLTDCFGMDCIEPVAKGVRGADILQRVRDEYARPCGTIIWECKQTKTWSDGWLRKLKDDQIEQKADLAVLVSAALPREMTHFECRENVWVTPPSLALPLARALRLCLIQTAAARNAGIGQESKRAQVYDYLCSQEFKGRVTAIVEAFMTMRQELEKEKKAYARIWAAREKQLERVLHNTVGLYGTLQGIIGHSLPAIDGLELDALGVDVLSEAKALPA